MQFEAIEVALLTGLLAAPDLTPIAPRAKDANVVAGSHREAVDAVDGLSVEVFPDLSQQAEDAPAQLGQAMQPTIEVALAEHVGHVARLAQQRAGLLEVAAEVEGGDEGGGEDFGIAHLALGVLVMAQRA